MALSLLMNLNNFLFDYQCMEMEKQSQEAANEKSEKLFSIQTYDIRFKLVILQWYLPISYPIILLWHRFPSFLSCHNILNNI